MSAHLAEALAERDMLRAENARLTHTLNGCKSIHDEDKADLSAARRECERALARAERAEAQVRAVEAVIDDPSVTYSTFCGEPCCAPPTDEKSTPMMVERTAIRAALAVKETDAQWKI